MLSLKMKIKFKKVILITITISIVYSGYTYNYPSQSNYDNSSEIFAFLQDLNRTIHKKANESQIYGNIFSGGFHEQVDSYITAIDDFQRSHRIRQICEIGFAGGHSATVFLHATRATGASYLAFDIWDRPKYENGALKWVKKKFPLRNITVIKGNSLNTVPQFSKSEFCDLIHIDGAHHKNFPANDLLNMLHIASVDNLLLIDDCSDSWPAVIQAVHDIYNNNLLKSEPVKHIAEGWTHRGAQKGWCISSYKTPPKSLLFLGKKFCVPPWIGKGCDKKNVKALCDKEDDRCFYDPVYGVASVSCERWKSAQSTEMRIWDTRNTSTDRNAAHSSSFNRYTDVPVDLGHVVEIAAGPFTQSQSIHRYEKRFKSITLVEPMAFHYMGNVKQCFYKNGSFADMPTTILSIPAEDLKASVKFDTVVMINVIEHVYDAFSILDKVVRMVKPGGTFIWHDRLWNNYTGLPRRKNDSEFQLHPIRLKTVVSKEIIKQFHLLYFANDTQELRRLKNEGVYFIGRMKHHNLPPSKLPYHPPCIAKSQGSEEIVFVISHQNIIAVTNYIKTASDYPEIKSIGLVTSQPYDISFIQSVVSVKKVQLFLSHHHFESWRKEIKKYMSSDEYCTFVIEPKNIGFSPKSKHLCLAIQSSLTTAFN